ncbi:hypothetical protein PanWU01x14_288310, partial [Parasponia andersonii]
MVVHLSSKAALGFLIWTLYVFFFKAKP